MLHLSSAPLNTNYHVITNATYSCHNHTLCLRISNTSQILKLVRYYAVIISRCGKLPCKHGGKWCLLLWQKRQNSSKILMDQLIKVDEKTSVNYMNHIIHRSFLYDSCQEHIRSWIETCMLCKSSASENVDGIWHIFGELFFVFLIKWCYKHFRSRQI